jgi:hypothetical protein
MGIEWAFNVIETLCLKQIPDIFSYIYIRLYSHVEYLTTVYLVLANSVLHNVRDNALLTYLLTHSLHTAQSFLIS